jgi:hypothetical protein
VGPDAENIGWWSTLLAARLSSWLLGIDVVGARDGFWCGYRLTLLHLVAKLSHVGADVDGLACCLHCPVDCGCQAHVQCLLTGVVMSCHTTWGGAALVRLSEGGCEAPGLSYLM